MGGLEIPKLLRIEIPDFLSHLPVWQGKPVPFSVIWIDGVPDFRVIDHAKRVRCVMERLCAVCGRKLGEYGWFIGGPLSLVTNSLFADPPQHEHCGRFSIQICPFLNGTITESSDTSKRPVAGSIVNPLSSSTRSDKVGLRRAKRWEPVNVEDYALIRVTKWYGQPIWLA